MRHEDAWKRLPDLLDDRDDAELLAHVRSCADCQRQVFLLGRVDRLLRDGAREQRLAPLRRPIVLRALAAAAVVAASAALVAVFVPHAARAHDFMLRTASGREVAKAVMGDSDGRNAPLALVAYGLPVEHGHVFVLWAGGDNGSTMQVGRFMVDRSGGCRVRFNLPAIHSWYRFWVSEPANATAVVAST